MRWALVKVCLAVTTMVAVAFAVPLGLVVQEMASDRAFSNAERQAATMGPTLSITTDPVQLRKAVESTEMGAARRMAVHVPALAGAAPVDIGAGWAGAHAVDETRSLGRATTARAVGGGSALLQPIALGSGDIAVIEIYVPESEVSNGVATAWLVLAGVGLALVVGSVAVADRLGARLVRPAERLADAAHQLGEGRLGARVPEDGPKELRSAAVAFNSMADQVVELLANERELAADLSHRLRTPLTVLRLNTASLGDGPAAEHTRAAVEQLEREVDTIIRTAREQRPPAAAPATAGCDASEVIRDRMAFWSALAEDEGRTVRLAGVDRTVRVPVARPELAAALDALLGNVFRHTPEGTPFAVDVHDAGDAVIVLVSDAGPGIADPDAALRRGNDGARDGSTGLGLDIVRRVAESTGGDVRLGRSVLGGTEVRVWLALGDGARRGGRGPGARRARRTRGGRRGGRTA
ncbi:HAMP domain-containing sensor histidine kinase [Streptomyces sp. NPDC001674]|uniref:sensor histidine kinase n=1 Tax=unclassified Streptomyces TaxID=2593676 RepID=UPI00331931FD